MSCSVSNGPLKLTNLFPFFFFVLVHRIPPTLNMPFSEIWKRPKTPKADQKKESLLTKAMEEQHRKTCEHVTADGELTRTLFGTLAQDLREKEDETAATAQAAQAVAEEKLEQVEREHKMMTKMFVSACTQRDALLDSLDRRNHDSEPLARPSAPAASAPAASATTPSAAPSAASENTTPSAASENTAPSAPSAASALAAPLGTAGTADEVVSSSLQTAVDDDEGSPEDVSSRLLVPTSESTTTTTSAAPTTTSTTKPRPKLHFLQELQGRGTHRSGVMTPRPQGARSVHEARTPLASMSSHNLLNSVAAKFRNACPPSTGSSSGSAWTSEGENDNNEDNNESVDRRLFHLAAPVAAPVVAAPVVAASNKLRDLLNFEIQEHVPRAPRRGGGGRGGGGGGGGKKLSVFQQKLNARAKKCEEPAAGMTQKRKDPCPNFKLDLSDPHNKCKCGHSKETH